MTDSVNETVPKPALMEEAAGWQPRPVWLIVLGVAMLCVGLCAVAFPLITTLAVEAFVGVALLGGGIVTAIQAFAEKAWKGFFWLLAIGVLNALAGLVLLLDPFGGVLALTLALGAVFLAEGVLRIAIAFRSRQERPMALMIASGAMAILLGGLILAGIVNGSSLVLLGVLAGLNLIFAGVSLMSLGLSQRSSAHRGPQT